MSTIFRSERDRGINEYRQQLDDFLPDERGHLRAGRELS
jgi:hypothetical protein